jgi:predicted ArsR family transcriptional regulator
MREQKNVLEKKLRDELTAARLPQLSQQIMALIKSRGPTSVGEVVAVTSANRNTVKLHFKNLVRDGHLISEGNGRGVRYRLKTE